MGAYLPYQSGPLATCPSQPWPTQSPAPFSMSHPIRIPQPLQHLTEPLFPSPSLRASIELSCLSSWSLGFQVLFSSSLALPLSSHVLVQFASPVQSGPLQMPEAMLFLSLQWIPDAEAMPFLTATVNLLSSYQEHHVLIFLFSKANKSPFHAVGK